MTNEKMQYGMYEPTAEGKSILDDTKHMVGYELTTNNLGKPVYVDVWGDGKLKGRTCDYCNMVRKADKLAIQNGEPSNLCKSCLNKWATSDKQRVLRTAYQTNQMKDPKKRAAAYEAMKRFHKRNPEVAILRQSQRRARISNLPNEMSGDQIKAARAHFGNSCFITGNAEHVAMDHVLPLRASETYFKHNGIHTELCGTVPQNILPLNRSLNSRKGAKNVFDWFFEEFEDGFFAHSEYMNFIRGINYLAAMVGMSFDEYKAEYEKAFNA